MYFRRNLVNPVPDLVSFRYLFNPKETAQVVPLAFALH
jgi:hypothetical protein